MEGMIHAPLPGCNFAIDSKPRVSHKTLHPGLISLQPSRLATPEACKDFSPGYAFFAYPGKTFPEGNRTPKVVRGSFWVAVILLAFAFGPHIYAQTKPSRIVSTTLATDEILAALVDPSRIVAMSQYAADPQISNVADVARRINVTADRDAERVVRLQPDIILSTRYSKVDLKFLMQKARIPYVELDRFETVADIESNIRAVGQALHEEHRSDEIIATMRQKIAAAAGSRRWKVLYLAPGEWTAGTNTTVNELIRIAGLRNAAAEAGIIGNTKISAEHIIQMDPDVVLIGTGYQRDIDFQNSLEKDLRFSTVKAMREKQIVVLPSKYVLTTSQFIADGALELSRRIKALP